MSVERIVGCCGLVCTDCPAYLATVNNDDELRKSTAKKWSEMVPKKDIKPEAINCDGCTTPGTKFHHCNECEMRLCGIAKGVKNCGWCKEYPCEKNLAFFQSVPQAREVLDGEKTSSRA